MQKQLFEDRILATFRLAVILFKVVEGHIYFIYKTRRHGETYS